MVSIVYACQTNGVKELRGTILFAANDLSPSLPCATQLVSELRKTGE